ncbi:tRNA-dihydrouridine synthase [Planosporangium flavigriseum]|uniref:tRNA-dihydrouridine synthase n=1 Tax=Planosporangium flavigriseum TaxID=373681 RepID=A0A8J3LT20_9ACTN|nr:tRNA-dihydrouridine synthase [Planosporangium flavigriseum]NJC65847.1 tRNA-dihydrouridine synthase [Planosporangium flavigriseum]GIG76108.1 hypothetical protein Pfl04_45120 [Planosporangium flavigriseum]
MPPTRRKSASVTLGVTSLLAVALTGACGSQRAGGDEYGAVCVDPQTQQRIDDDYCDDDTHYHSGGGWYFIRSGRSYPAKGQKVSGGSFSRPGGGSTVKYGGVAAQGGPVVKADSGSVSRGGFGGKSGGSGS